MLAIWVVVATQLPDLRMVIECAALLGLGLLQTARPTFLGWAVMVVWFAWVAVETVEVSMRPGNAFQVLPFALTLVPLAFLLVFRPRAEASERFLPALAALAGLVGLSPLFVMWAPR